MCWRTFSCALSKVWRHMESQPVPRTLSKPPVDKSCRWLRSTNLVEDSGPRMEWKISGALSKPPARVGVEHACRAESCLIGANKGAAWGSNLDQRHGVLIPRPDGGSLQRIDELLRRTLNGVTSVEGSNRRDYAHAAGDGDGRCVGGGSFCGEGSADDLAGLLTAGRCWRASDRKRRRDYQGADG